MATRGQYSGSRREEAEMTEPGSNLARVLALWGEMSHSQTMAPLAEAMAEGVVWQGLLPELVCHGRNEVRDVLGSARGGQLPRVTRMEAEEAGDRVVVTVEGPDFGPGPAGTALEPVGGPRTLALWFEDGRIVRMESFATRQEALGVTT
jgi:SnoaL-like domain